MHNIEANALASFLEGGKGGGGVDHNSKQGKKHFQNSLSQKSSFTFYQHYNLFTDLCHVPSDRLVLISFNMYNSSICINL